MFKLGSELYFPPVSYANKHGILAIGGDLSTERLLLAYKNGIFPWYSKGEEIHWWAPNPRMILLPNEIKISKSMRSLIRKNIYTITENQAFDKVIHNCAIVQNRNKKEPWLHDEMIEAYTQLHRKGYANSIEVWNKDNKLVGGLYTVQVLPNIISGESMFHIESNTSKLAFIHLAKTSKENGVKMIDCQIYTPHLESLGAKEIPRDVFMFLMNYKPEKK